ncbi:hybrid sensor histidine kinase/response regulator [Salisediminibacterium beveridgei]|uniref:histidine kinase n=1 Tax=Salisediminibacterium beveridgei TaxID=632773 RepID=A0A1D7QYI9_9BACI|nr:ATP-binding protein [Salisediminibacterium beveridgei]AOM84067.1 hypothetical protein BBEV_2730 [Salisediminibacterium beveridgei]
MEQLSTNKKIFFLILLLVVVLTGLRFSWIYYFAEENFPSVENGFLDMRAADFSGNKYYSLEGEWGFFPDERIDPADPPAFSHATTVPALWDHTLLNTEDTLLGEGSYYLELELPEDMDKDLGVRFYEINSAAAIYSNGELVYARNDLDHEYGDRGMDYGPVDITLSPPEDGRLELVIHVSNHAIEIRGGMARDVLIGSDDALASLSFASKALQLSAGLVLALHAVYAFILFGIQRQSRTRLLLLFGLMLSLFATGVFIDDEVLVMLPVSLPDYFKMLLTIFILTLFVMFLIIARTVHVSEKFIRPIAVFFVLLAMTALMYPIAGYTHFTSTVMLIFFVFALAMLVITIRSISRGNVYGYFILIFLIAYTSNMTWGALIKLNVLQFPFYPMDFIFSMMALMGLVLKQHVDITRENRKQADIIIENEKNKDRFLANTAHELRNPLHGIMTVNDTLLNQLEAKPKEAIRDDLLLNRKIGQQMKFILDDLRDFTLLKESRVRLMPEAVAVHPMVQTILDILHFQLDSRFVTFKTDLPEDLPPLLADQERLFQVLYNLLHNAVKFTKEGSISVTARHLPSSGMVHLIIADTGSGIQEADQERLFIPYEQGDGSDRGGLGLGLNISRELTGLHEGKLQIESREECGTEVHIHWPAAEGGKINHVPLFEQETERSKKPVVHQVNDAEFSRILISDDDAGNLELLEKALEDEYSITKALSGKEALKLIQTSRFDLVISDVMMPEMSGYELTAAIRKEYDLIQLPVLLLTARYHPADIAAGFQAGANDYVSKPFELAEFKARVATLTQLKQSVYKQIETEAAWLQSQIRPHFLYNTLNTIASLGHYDTDKMVDLLYEFGDYLKNSFRSPSKDGFITLEEEMNLIRPYLYIQKTRFADQLATEIDIKNEADILVPPLAVQTLVENAVNHGALKNRGNGTVLLYASSHKTHAEIVISDNGPGRADDLLKRLEETSASGIGLKNTQDRIKALNGEGLLITDNPGGGIRITITLPKRNLR